MTASRVNMPSFSISQVPHHALLLTALLAAAPGCGDDTGTAESDLTSCDGAYVDDGGRCRRPDGRFARAICCTPSSPTERRNLDAYACPADAEVPVAFFDADSTLRVSKSGTPTASSAEDVNVLPFAAPYITELQERGYLVAIVSNQGGVAAGITPFEVAHDALVFTASQLTALGGTIDYLDFADQKDEYRKPNTRMGTELEERLVAKCGTAVDWDGSFMVGDAGYKKNVDGPHPDGRPADDFSNSDRLFAENLGIDFSEPTDAFGWRAFGFYNIRYQSQLLGVLEAMQTVVDELRASGDDPERLAELEHEIESIREINAL